MDPSALIFVALAVAWAVYLVPKALEHHDESLRSRTVSTFSHTMRVLARREPVSERATRLVPGARPDAGPATAGSASDATGTQRPARSAEAASRSAAKRRRNVLAVLVLANVAVAAGAGLGKIGWMWMAVPVVLLVGWLVACRLMVRRERVTRRMAPTRPDVAPTYLVDDETGEIVAVIDERVTVDVAQSAVHVAETGQSSAAATGSWDPVAVPLPTYVSKPPAVRRTVRTIDLDSTGVWSSGRSESDSALAREADAARRDVRAEQPERRATGS